MVEKLKPEEVNSSTDPSVAKQFDDTTPKTKQWQDLYDMVDDLKIGLLTTNRPDVGPVARSMAIAKRSGPDFLFLANAHSKKFQDLAADKSVSVTFQNSSTQDWICISGQATTTSNEDPRIAQVFTKMTRAWFGDLKDGVHTGGPEDPRVKLIEVKAKYITYYKAKTSALGFLKETMAATFTGGVAQTGDLREFSEEEIKQARERDADLTK